MNAQTWLLIHYWLFLLDHNFPPRGGLGPKGCVGRTPMTTNSHFINLDIHMHNERSPIRFKINIIRNRYRWVNSTQYACETFPYRWEINWKWIYFVINIISKWSGKVEKVLDRQKGSLHRYIRYAWILDLWWIDARTFSLKMQK